MHSTLLSGLKVIELGLRPAVRICASLLANAGATVTALDAADGCPDAYTERIRAADIVIMSSDMDDAALQRAVRAAAGASPATIVCDITAGGPTGPYSRHAYDDGEIQALTGLMDTTGFSGHAPTAIGVPYCELSAGIYAAVASLAALRLRRLHAIGQDISVSLVDCATSALSTFLPHVFAGHNPGRLGNRHSSAAPWNAYPSTDGWVLICTSTQEQWARLAALVGASVADDATFATPQGRVEHVERLDRLIAAWSAQHTTDECLRQCGAADIPCGPIVALRDLAREPNLAYRGAIGGDTEDGPAGWIPAAPFRVRALGTNPLAPTPAPAASAVGTAAPLAGMRVIEIGQFTTAPLVGKHLATLGAEVIKIEPPEGDVTRRWRHGQGDTSYFFVLSNTGKQSVCIDLKSAAGRQRFVALLQQADVLVENLRPGALARLGFDSAALASLNPRLVYCAISGFGADSAYPGRPAFDTVIQAMSGFMDLTRSNGVPTKAGISAADIISGQIGLFTVLACLLQRDHSGVGACVDISMQDCAAWATHPAWQRAAGLPANLVLACNDGHVAVGASKQDAAAALGGEAAFAALQLGSRTDAVAAFARAALRAVPVRSVAELVEDPHFRTYGLGLGRDPSGRFWPVLLPPYRFSFSIPPAAQVVGDAGADTARVLTGVGE